MRKLTLILLLIPFLVYSQQAREPFTKANAIIIPIEESQEQAYKKIAQILSENGFGIASSDALLGIITTTEKDYKNGTLKLNAFVTQNKIRLSGNFTIDALNMTSRIDYKGMKNSAGRNAWDIMQQIASQYKQDLLYAAN